MSRRFLVTGGAGFIGSAVVRHLIGETQHRVLVVDNLTYASNLASLASVTSDSRYAFERANICDANHMRELFRSFRPNIVMHLAAESHVDRSIDGPGDFIHTNIVGTFTLLQTARDYLRNADGADFRFHHVSTDEVFGSLGAKGHFDEQSPYRPNSPYAASKASADHLARAWHRTYGLPVVISNSSNNYGPCQFPEKLIPLTIINALEGTRLPVYGSGTNVRDWLYVEDHARALTLIAECGSIGASYNVGGDAEVSNLAVVRSVCALVDELAPAPGIGRRERLISHVDDRPGHDYRYALNSSKIRAELGWKPMQSFKTGLRRTVEWYIANPQWWQPIRSGVYRGERLGVGSRS
jgi:dTDP-glucose 4,6-dehydratase